MDPGVLVRLVPGMARLEQTGDDAYNAVFEIKLGLVSGSFTGHLHLENKQEPEHFDLRLQQASKIGNASAVISIRLEPVEAAATALTFEGDVKLSGLLASMGQRVIGGVANTLTKQFFSNLERELAKGVTA